MIPFTHPAFGSDCCISLFVNRSGSRSMLSEQRVRDLTGITDATPQVGICLCLGLDLYMLVLALEFITFKKFRTTCSSFLECCFAARLVSHRHCCLLSLTQPPYFALTHRAFLLTRRSKPTAMKRRWHTVRSFFLFPPFCHCFLSCCFALLVLECVRSPCREISPTLLTSCLFWLLWSMLQAS